MNVGSFQTISLVGGTQVKGRILTMPGGDQDPHYLVEIIEEHKKHPEKTNVGCKVIVPRDKVFKYNNKQKDEKTVTEVIFETYDVVAQYKDRDDARVFDMDSQYWDINHPTDKKEVSNDMEDLTDDIANAIADTIEKSGNEPTES